MPPIPTKARPSENVEANALRLIVAGYLPFIAHADDYSEFLVPSQSTGSTYRVIAVDGDDYDGGDHQAFECECTAGRKGTHCTHVAIAQLLAGYSSYWAPRERAKLPSELIAERQTSPQPPPPPAEDRRIESRILQDLGTLRGDLTDLVANAKVTFVGQVVRFEGTGCGVTTDALKRHRKEAGTQAKGLLKAKAIALAALLKPGTQCVNCRAETEPFGKQSQICTSCGVISPTHHRKEEVAA